MQGYGVLYFYLCILIIAEAGQQGVRCAAIAASICSLFCRAKETRRLKKNFKPYGTSVRELKDAAFNERVKKEIAFNHTNQMSKIERLKAQRLAHHAQAALPKSQ